MTSYCVSFKKDEVARPEVNDVNSCYLQDGFVEAISSSLHVLE